MRLNPDLREFLTFTLAILEQLLRGVVTALMLIFCYLVWQALP